MHKIIIKIVSLFAVFTSFAQNSYKTSIDTADVAYREELKTVYNQRSAKTFLTFKGISDRNLKNNLVKSHGKLSMEFINKVNQGLFFKTALYEEKINALFKQISDANPQYPELPYNRIFISFADTPNAFAMIDGFIVVNLPLLASLDNQHELAFVICHELAHNILNHPQHGLTEYAKVESSEEIEKQSRKIESKKYNKAENAAGLYKSIIYATRKKHREVEFQADSLGFIFFKNAFAGNESLALKSFITLENIDRDKDSLELKDYEKLFSSFKKEWLSNDEISTYKYNKTLKFWQIDSLKTHPDCIDRANRLKALFGTPVENFKTANSDHDQFIQNAQYDHVLGLFVLREYGKSLYNALLLLKNNPDDKYLIAMAYYNLVKIQEAQKNYKLNKYVETINPRYSTSYNTFLSFIRQLRKSDLSEIINEYSAKT